MQTSQSAVLSLKDKEEREVKYICKNLKYVKPMIKEILKSTGFLILLYCKGQQTPEGTVIVAKFLYMPEVEEGREYLRKAFYGYGNQEKEVLIQ